MLGLEPPDVATEFDMAVNVRLALIDEKQIKGDKKDDKTLTVRLEDGTSVPVTNVERW